jgi:TonB family protein
MFENQSQLEKNASGLPAAPAASGGARQHRLMAAALALLIIALLIVIYRSLSPSSDEEADYDPPADATATTSIPDPVPAPAMAALPAAKGHASAKNHAGSHAASSATKSASPDPASPTAATDAPPMTAQTERTVLPPLEVEVVAGDNHQTVRPGSNSVRLDLQRGVPPQPSTEATAAAPPDTAASSTHDAAEKVEMSAGEQLVTRTVRPEYPLLARQAKVQGSVILQVLIGKDGVIQNLRVVGGPPILASAAQDAVRQWRFKPHVVGQEAVETQAKIIVNFTISTN